MCYMQFLIGGKRKEKGDHRMSGTKSLHFPFISRLVGLDCVFSSSFCWACWVWREVGMEMDNFKRRKMKRSTLKWMHGRDGRGWIIMEMQMESAWLMGLDRYDYRHTS